ncbi:MAG: hypothetical protein A2487_03855 [Candidatus Raymondbacteria bacterium RifOxyC12_full_50_8]|nr:MAG: hypothetical protein A2248_07390 [Candidatus Raymondbacteria bacterium RIFOXYA2_FULL_49_16]OGJ96485.1 MAG: hypothetical protein A2453_00010 [Candidatus Raymondbacteria bacterium RIFOXYC2_FULL_50_21]OGK06766.1 MAG: hypothetical protein A2487_03855 [Candidatus Raymondbacteria bacterium RifOxyC12_full_50_8]OGP41565.1 MAG: hypothetical protein A2324_09400 [Candidatus Raymondbacteria bacterium RIFOXYB2_FULL_49_35]
MHRELFLNRFLFLAVCVTILILNAPTSSATPANLTALHKHGQTFLTWNDVSGATKYRIYRSTSMLAASDLTPAHRIAEIDSGSSYMKYWADLSGLRGSFKDAVGTGYFRITDLGAPLGGSDELFVWTCQENGGGNFYYAVTAVSGSSEDASAASGNTTGPVSEEQCTMIYPVEQVCTSDSSGHVFVQWMPYDKWNTQLEGYAYPFYLAAKKEFKGLTKKISVNVHGRGAYFNSWMSDGPTLRTAEAAYNSTTLGLFCDDPRTTWHYGFADQLEFGGPKPMAMNGSTVKNFTEYRNWCPLRWLLSGNAPWRADRNDMYIAGHSMGGTGSMTWSIHHPELFAYNESSEGINSWPSAGTQGGTYWAESSQWGSTSAGVYKNLACHDLIPLQSNILIDDRNVGFSIAGWMDVRDSVLPTIAQRTDLPFLNFSHGTQDGTIEWPTQGRPVWSDHANNKFAANKIPYSGAWIDVGHTNSQKGHNPCGKVPKTHFVLAVASATSDEELAQACLTGFCNDDGQFNARVFWSTTYSVINKAPVDSPELFETTIKLKTAVTWGIPNYTGSGTEHANITPRRLQRFPRYAHGTYHWVNTQISGAVVASGNVTADENGIFTVGNFEYNAVGNVLSVTVADTGDGLVASINTTRSLAGQTNLSVFPNPFNPSTTITLTAPADLAVRQHSFEIYTVAGKLIMRHVFPGINSSRYTYSWNAAQLPSGVYIIKAISGNHTVSKHISLIK